MSRIGKQPIVIPQGVEIKLEGSVIHVKGPKGELTQELHRWVNINQKDNELIVSVKSPDEKKQAAMWGLFKRLIENMVIGVTNGFSKKLEVNGVGYKVVKAGNDLVLNVGYSHPVNYASLPDINIEVEKNIITVSGSDKQKVGQVASEIRAIKKPEPYKGKGIKYIDEIIKKKVGKAAAKGE